MKSTTRKPAAKIVTVIARIFIKKNGHVVYLCRGSKGEQYNTTVIDGKATGCGCPAYKPCKHMDHCEKLEQSRIANIEQAAQAGDTSFQQAIDAILDADYAARGAEIAQSGTLNHNRKAVAPVGKSAIETSLAVRGWMR